MSESKPIMRSIRDFGGYTFIIPSYQRGFRWTKQQVKELIDDLNQFFDSESLRQKYCLQNIVVQRTENENEYYVVDGQQRLTAMWLLIMSFMDSVKYDHETLPVYQLKYAGKEIFENYISNISGFLSDPQNCCQKTISTFQPGDSIDAKYLHNALSYIVNEYRDGAETYATKLLDIFSSSFLRDKKEICFIWNELDSSGGIDAAIGKFSNINANKIPLTESELIKAYLINAAESEDAREISYQWETMERKMNDDSFWAFISGEEEETRMDLLFRVWLGDPNRKKNENPATRHFLSKAVYEEIKESNAKALWDEIVQIFSVLCDWYDNYYFFHMIGLVIAVCSEGPTKAIYSLYQDYQQQSKEEFKQTLKKKVRCSPCYKSLPANSDKNDSDWHISEATELDLDNDDLAYNKDKAKIKAILLLFNISLLLNAYQVNPLNASERFSFETYKDKKNSPIEIEHINPKHLEGKKADKTEYTPQEKTIWAKKTLEIIPEEDRGDLEDRINRATWIGKEDGLVSIIEEKAGLNRLSNLTLVDKQLNISYGDRFFLEKRRYILAARFGLFAYGIAKREHSVIFPGTMWVFMRQYIDAAGDLSEEEKEILSKDRWTDMDRNKYIQMMQESIFGLLCNKPGSTETEVGEKNV